MKTPTRPSLLAMLAAHEWVPTLLSYGDTPVRLFCRGRQDKGHAPGCPLAAVLAWRAARLRAARRRRKARGRP